MIMLEKFGVRVANPEKEITIEGESFANLALHFGLHVENLQRAAGVLRVVNDDRDERLSLLQGSLQAMANSTAGCLSELMRIAAAQGLQFDIEKSDVLKH